MAVHLINIRSDVLLRFTPFLFYLYTLTIVMMNCLIVLSFSCGIRVTQKANVQFMHLFRVMTFFLICMMLREAVRNVDIESHRMRQKMRPTDRDRQIIG